MSTIATKKRFNGPIRHKMAVASGYTPTVGDRVELTSNDNEVQEIPAATNSTGKFVGTIFQRTADGSASYCVVELIFNTLMSIASAAAISAPARGCLNGQKVKTYVSGSDDALDHNCTIFEAATGADEDVIVGF